MTDEMKVHCDTDVSMSDPPTSAHANTNANSNTLEGHAYHYNLPPQYMDPKDGIPLVTKYAQRKSNDIVKIAYSIHLTEDMFLGSDDEGEEAAEGGGEDTSENANNDIIMSGDDADNDDELDSEQIDDKKATLKSITQKCNRLSSLISTLDNLRYNGISQQDSAQLLIHLLRLISATVLYSKQEESDGLPSKRVEIHYDNVGLLYDTATKKIVYNPHGNSDNHKNDSVDDGVEHEFDDDDETKPEEYLKEPFALPSPARESLLSIVISMLSKERILRSVSNTSFRVGINSDGDGANEGNANADGNLKQQEGSSLLLVIHWKAMLRILLRTAPYLNEHECGVVGVDSLSRQSTILKRTVVMVRYLRRFYDQGYKGVKDNILSDKTAREVWDMIQSDLMRQTQSNACYRALILLYLFQPSRCSRDFYKEMLPMWLESWTAIDRCPDVDSLWLTIFCRARKYVEPTDFDWGVIRRRLLTLCAYWLQIPVGGKSSDKSFPNAAQAKSRSIPSRLKAFLGNSNSYQEGVDFVSKLSKLLVFCIGKNDYKEAGSFTTQSNFPDVGGDNVNAAVRETSVSDATEDLLRFFAFVGPYFHPSNTGNWTFPLGVLLHYFSYEFCRRLARDTSHRALTRKHPKVASKTLEVEPYKKYSSVHDHETVLILDSVLPLCQQALYSKSARVSRGGEQALLYLSQIDHKICPMFLDFAMSALDISSVALSHQAPAALSVLSKLVLPSLKRNPSFFLERLPEILRLTLAGIDSNDQQKTMRTLILYRTITSWIPVGKSQSSASVINSSTDSATYPGSMWFGEELVDAVNQNCESDDYWQALKKLPTTSLLYQAETAYSMDHEEEQAKLSNLMEETAYAMGDWSLAFLERIFDLFRAAGVQEKVGKSSGVASRHASADASNAKHFNRLLKQCLFQVFASTDDTNFESAARAVETFLRRETHPMAVKYAAILCEAVCAARTHPDRENHSPGLKILLPLLLEDIHHKSKGTVLYRLRCIGGAVRQAGRDVMNHRQELFAVLQFALGDEDNKDIFKAGCKLLRHLLSSQCESYHILSDGCPRVAKSDSLGKPARLAGDKVAWHIPSGIQIDFVTEVLTRFTFSSLNILSDAGTILRHNELSNQVNGKSDSDVQEKVDLAAWRRALKILRYSLRGTSGLLLEADTLIDVAAANINEFDPTEIAISTLVNSSSSTARSILSRTRGDLSLFLSLVLSIIARGCEATEIDTTEEDGQTTPVKKAIQTRSTENLIASDVKICKEVSQLSILLATRRGACIHSQDEMSLWSMQDNVATDRMLSDASKEITTVLLKSGCSQTSTLVLYSDGEEGGKSLSRKMAISAVDIFLHHLQRNSSFEVPRRLRRKNRKLPKKQEPAFSRDVCIADLYNFIGVTFNHTQDFDQASLPPSNLFCYEGMIDGGFALACHTNNLVRSVGYRLVEHLMTRFGWFACDRVNILLCSLALSDSHLKRRFGLISCEELASMDNVQHRKRLAEVLKGISSLLALPRIMKEVIPLESHRLSLIKVLCNSQRVISLLPPEEMQKMIHYFHAIFSKFRSKFYSFPRLTKGDKALRQHSLSVLLGVVNDEDTTPEESGEASSAHWRDRLVATWFLLTFIDKSDITSSNLWETCFDLIQRESGQPIQRATLGLIGKLATLTIAYKEDANISFLQKTMANEAFCVDLCKALVSNHKEDKSIGGGHKAQWSVGVESILKDAQVNVAPKIIFPFKRAGRSSTFFLIQHAQLLSTLLDLVGKEQSSDISKYFLSYAKELAASPPSEDQRNQLITSAELFAGVSHFLLKSEGNSEDHDTVWNSILLPFLEEALEKIPSSSLATYSDALRFSIRDLSPVQLGSMISWVIRKVEETLWRSGVEEPSTSVASDGFAAQSKWVVMMCVILIEIDQQVILKSWYSSTISIACEPIQPAPSSTSIADFWSVIITRLLPRLLDALGHPYQKCREQIAWCLFRIYNCYRKLMQQTNGDEDLLVNPGDAILRQMTALTSPNGAATKDHQHALITSRLFIFYCLHYGDNKNEYADFILPLLPMAFESIKPDGASEEEESEIDSEVRMLQAQVVKGFRYSIAEISASCFVTYNNSDDISHVLENLDKVSHHDVWQVRHAAAHFLRCFQGCHKFLFTANQTKKTTRIVAKLLADERKEVSAAAMSALTGILASTPSQAVADMVEKYVKKANNSVIKKKKVKDTSTGKSQEKELKRATNQQTSVYFLCAAVLSKPYDTPSYVPKALTALSRHSYEKSAPFTVREAVKLTCREFKRTHMTDNWELHKEQFTQEQLEALDDVVSTPHYYA